MFVLIDRWMPMNSSTPSTTSHSTRQSQRSVTWSTLLGLSLSNRQRSAMFLIIFSLPLLLCSISPVQSSASQCSFVIGFVSQYSSLSTNDIVVIHCSFIVSSDDAKSLLCSQGAGLQVPGVTELPVCTVCLERMVRCEE